ncbi:gamma-aminobutyric acid type B receptor subunit 1-like [Babylonia areolata]|uniref:gamma-aminobutyric acid type B receptor subunit 1-like n=1 Tax=Babylonia areolata TaxID=304850 RepID=UPI003FD35788
MFLLRALTLTLVVTETLTLKDIPLTLGGIFPMSGSWAGGMACKPAINMALAMVNNQTDILPEYELTMQYNDSQCMPGLGTKVLYQLLYDKPTKIMVLTGCSSVSTFVAQAANMWNLIVLAYGASSPALSNRERFPMFFRTHPSGTLHNPTRIKLFQLFKWKRIATIQETQETFTSTIEDLEKRVKEVDIDIAVRQSFLTDPTNAVRNLKRQDARIIVGVFYEDMARRVFCQAYKEKLYGKKYVWLIIGWYPDNWYRANDDRHNCTAEQLEEALEGHLTTEAVILHQEPTMTDVGMTAKQFTEQLNRDLNTTDPSLITGYPEAPLAYDAVWALAFALNKTAVRLAEKGMRLEDFDYHNEEIAQEIYSAMNSTKFLGISGNVAFSSQGDRIAWTQIEQMRNGTYHKLGFYDYVADNLTWFEADKWIGGKPPPDRTRVIDHLRVVSQTLYFAMCALAAIGIIAGFACLVFNYRNAQRRCVAFSQPTINGLTVLGCMLCLSCIFLLGLDGNFVSPDVYPFVCQVRAWFLSVGFTLSFGSMFSKIWTVHQLTTARKKDRKGVQIWELYTVLGVLLVLDVGVLVCWQVLDPMRRHLEVFAMEEPTTTEEDIQLRPQLEHCVSDNLSVWLGVLFGYKGILLIFGIFLAYETRSVKLKQVNDSRFVGMSIYNVVVLCVITAPISLIIGNQQDATFAFVSLAIVLCSFLSMGLIFVPKMMELAKHPQRDGQEIRGLTDSLVSREEEERHQRLVSENEQLKRQIAEMEDRVKDLNGRIQKVMQEQRNSSSAADARRPPPPTYSSCLTTTTASITATSIPTPALKPDSIMGSGGGGGGGQGIHFQLDDSLVVPDNNSDSGMASWSTPKSPKILAAELEPLC